MTPGLIERLEAAGEGSRELDAEIAVRSAYRGAVRIVDAREESIFRHQPGWCRDANDISILVPNYTTSLDAALALAERVLDSKSALHLLADLLSYEAAQSDFDLIKTDDLPRLLCIAILKARATQEQG